jgi:hypothetical protein
LIFFLFPGKDEEQRLFADYQAQDAIASPPARAATPP